MSSKQGDQATPAGKPSKFAEQNRHTAERKAEEAKHPTVAVTEPPTDTDAPEDKKK